MQQPNRCLEQMVPIVDVELCNLHKTCTVTMQDCRRRRQAMQWNSLVASWAGCWPVWQCGHVEQRTNSSWGWRLGGAPRQAASAAEDASGLEQHAGSGGVFFSIDSVRKEAAAFYFLFWRRVELFLCRRIYGGGSGTVLVVVVYDVFLSFS
jgi:hypothetical protein